MDFNVDQCIWGEIPSRSYWKYSTDYKRAAILLDGLNRAEIMPGSPTEPMTEPTTEPIDPNQPAQAPDEEDQP